MKTLFTLLCLMGTLSVQASELPASVTVVESAGAADCDSSWYINLNDLNLWKPYSPCYEGLAVIDAAAYLDSLGKTYTELFANVTIDLRPETVLELAWNGNMNSVTVRLCANSCRDFFTSADKIDVTANYVGADCPDRGVTLGIHQGLSLALEPIFNRPGFSDRALLSGSATDETNGCSGAALPA